MLSSTPCHLCASLELQPESRYEGFKRVASDCTPWHSGGKLAVCFACGGVQAVTDAAWQEDAEQIYRNYSIWHQSGGEDQRVFGANSSQTSRSVWILDRLCRDLTLPAAGRLLDIGCGNGALLAAARLLLPGWSLHASEFDDRNRSRIESITGEGQLHTGPIESIAGRFDLIILSHVFEHWVSPVRELHRLTAMLQPDGAVFIQVPDYTQNPFDLLIADHASHFCRASLSSMVQRAAYRTRIISTEWVPREISLVVQPGYGEPIAEVQPEDAATCVRTQLDWLARMRQEAIQARARCANSAGFGIFGTSIAGTWLFSELDGQAGFFVDEDQERVGKRHLSLPILSPGNVPSGSTVFVPLADSLAASVKARLRLRH